MVKKIINNAMIMVEEYDVKNPRTYVAHRSKVPLAKKMGQKDVDPLFKLPRLPAEAIKELAEELSEFELPARQLDAEVIDEFHSQASEIPHRGRDHHSSILSDPLLRTSQAQVLQQVQKTAKTASSNHLYSLQAQLDPAAATRSKYSRTISK